ncbi:UvrD-helicase domain-containing protein [Myceligenerans crystallogenes]|uniref:DNA 3'-5' helicase n=1 Tax=Myceligenerans crystallogenes TaxID=316335 RepID=A0ABP4ZTA4_9MICO
MPQVIIPSEVPSLDGSVRSQAYAFLDKLRRDDTLPSLHIEPMKQAADRRVRTGRVSQFWRAVLVKLTGSDDEPRYVYLGTFPHDDAIAYARGVIFQRNPRTGVAEVIRVDPDPAGLAGIESTPGPDAAPPAVPGPPTGTSPAPILQVHGVTFEDLLDLGIDSQVAHQALLAADETQLLEVALAAPSKLQSDALLLLGDGSTPAQVRASYAVGPVAADATPDTDDDLIDALDHPASRMQFAYLEDDDDLRAAIEDEDFARWRVFLHPEQRKYAEARTNGAFRLSGGAGTGKTVVLLHRARHLHRANPSARILLTTYNKTLAKALQDNLLTLDKTLRLAKKPGDPGIYIGTIDAVSWHLVLKGADHGLDVAAATSAVLGHTRADVVPATKDGSWKAAVRQAGQKLPESLRNEDFLASEYATVVVPAYITARDVYLRTQRPGRGVSLGRAQRNAVWDVVDAYRTAAARAGTTDYDEKAMIAATALDAAAERGGARLADHVLVDEAQDLTPARVLLLRALVAPGPDDLFLAEDSLQRIYSPRIVLSRHGIRVTGRSRRLTLNYRTTAQNLGYASGILSGREVVGMDDDVDDADGLRSSRSGPPPTADGYDTLEKAFDAAADRVENWLEAGEPAETIAVLLRSSNEATMIVSELSRRGLPVQYVGAKDQPRAGRVVAMTMHRSKGMEFRSVLVFGTTTRSASAVDRLPDGDRPDALQRERSLLYVATTRARDNLALVWDGDRSELLPEWGPGRAPAGATIAGTEVPDAHAALAREMHDTVGHSLAEIALSASALEVAAGTDPAVRELLASIRAAARRAGHELRGILASLRTGAEGRATVSFADLTDHLTRLRAQGARITSNVVVTHGASADAALARACYRIVQESVTNALKHAPGLPIDITLRGAPTTGVTLVVRNPLPAVAPAGSTTGSGSGIEGMTARATELGGTLSARAAAGRFIVNARLPWRGAR